VLHIKLPKKRVAHALMARAAMLDSLAANAGSDHDGRAHWSSGAARLREWARATQMSTGDVYVSTELWSQIEGYYDV
jgi:hypothetical protein